MPPADDLRPPLPPPRYSLRTLLLAVTACGLFFGAFWWFSPSIVVCGAALGLMIAAHVLGNSMGTSLRDRATPRLAQLTHEQKQEAFAGRAPTTHLGDRGALSWLMIVPTGLGALLAMIVGCWWIESTYHLGFDLAGLAVEASAFAVLGGLAAFALATFSQVLGTAIWQAMRHK
jgi:hypothetical protein